MKTMTDERIAELRTEAMAIALHLISYESELLFECLDAIESLQSFDEKVEREKFEAWHKDKYGWTSPISDTVSYNHEQRWQSWLACAKSRGGVK